ncbi:MAG: hypothetical protein DME05_12685 [Candidatus Rokuibacteriota bacterium]|nr:MAG: hypothetical protein DME05_12685 [Candidatus Rokubacteria bacterium]
MGSGGAVAGGARRAHRGAAPPRGGALTMRHLTAMLACALVGYPLLIAPATSVLTLGVVALALCGLGFLLGPPVVVGGAVVALGEYALALWLAGSPPRLAGAVLFGVGVTLLLQTADFGWRARRAALGPGVVASQIRHWARFGVVAGATTLAAVGAASAASASVRLPWAPALATVGAAVALVAVAFAVRRPAR